MANPIKLYQYSVEHNSSSPDSGYHLVRSKYDMRVERYCFDMIIAHVWESDGHSQQAIMMVKAHFESVNPDVKSESNHHHVHTT